MNKTRQKKEAQEQPQSSARHIFGLLAGFISADIGLHKTKEKPKFAPHVARCLFVLANQTEEATTLNVLAQNLGVSLPRASRICEDMVREGFISRERSPHDRREVELRVTAKTMEFSAQLWNQRKLPLEATLNSFSSDEVKVIERFLERLADEYKKAMDSP